MPSIHIGKKAVPASGTPGAQVLIVGDFPTDDDVSNGRPFTGRAGEKLDKILAAAGVNRAACYLTYLCHYRPADEQISYIEDSEEMTDGMDELRTYIKNHPPRLIISMGEGPLNYLLRRSSIFDWRGSYIKHDNIPTIITVSLKNILLNPEYYGVTVADIRKAIKLVKEKYSPPEYNFILNPRGLALQESIERIIHNPSLVTLDIECSKKDQTLRCVGFGLDENTAIVLNNNGPEFESALRTIFDSRQSYVFHNGNFDREVLRLNGYPLLEIAYDTMVAEHIISPSMPRDLGFLCSMYTNIPCYWSDITFSEDKKSASEKLSQDRLWTYNAFDCIVTYQVMNRQKDDGILDNPLYPYELEMLDVSNHISQAGFLVDMERKEMIKSIVESRLVNSQALVIYLTQRNLNFRSPKQVSELLYTHLELPTQRKRDGRPTTDDDAITKLVGYCATQRDKYAKEETKDIWRTKLAILKSLQQIRGYEKLISSYLDITVSPDNRVRSTWKVTGTETGRWSCANYVDGSGLNAQTFPRLVIEDEG